MGGGWVSKCWPAERYGELHRKIAERFGWRGVISFGPGEENLAREVISAAANPRPAATPLGLGPLMALLRAAKFVVSADTGPLHLASALGRPVVGIYGPTDPSRNGPFGTRFIVLRSPESRRDHTRRAAPEAGLLTIQPSDVLRAADALLYPESAS